MTDKSIQNKRSKLENALRQITNVMYLCGNAQRPVHECKGLTEMMDYLESLRLKADLKLTKFNAAHPEPAQETPPMPTAEQQ